MNLIKRVSNWIASIYSPRLMFALLLVAFGFFWLFNFSPLPLSNPELIKLNGGEGLLDIRPYYSAQEAYNALTHYGTAGRKLYIRFLTADFIFIPIYSLGFALLMTRTVRAVCGAVSHWLPLNLFPFVIGLFDCAENLCISGMLAIYPNGSLILGTLSGIATLCKWVLTWIAVLCLIYGGAVSLMRRFGFMKCALQRQ